MNKSAKIVLIGGSGYIGTYLAAKLNEQGFTNVFVLSRNPVKNQVGGIEYRSGADITKPQTLAPYIQDAEVIFNLAGLVSFNPRKKKELQAVNAEGAKNLVTFCTRLPKLKKLIHISSTAALGFADEAIREEGYFPWNSYSHLYYSYSKFIANEAFDCSDLPTNIVFPPMVLGPGDEKNTGSIIRYVGKKRRLFAPPGSNSFVDVRDLATALILVMEKAPPNENYIVASGTHSYAEIFKAAAKVRGNNPDIFVLPKFFFLPSFAVARVLERFLPNLHAENIYLGFKKREHDTTKIRALGFSPKFSLEQTFRDNLECKQHKIV